MVPRDNAEELVMQWSTRLPLKTVIAYLYHKFFFVVVSWISWIEEESDEEQQRNQ